MNYIEDKQDESDDNDEQNERWNDTDECLKKKKNVNTTTTSDHQLPPIMYLSDGEQILLINRVEQ